MTENLATRPERTTGERKPLRLPKATELVAEEIRRDIVRGALQPGDFLPTEANLIEQFGVSRPTLREALRVLESESLISLHKGARGGARVRGPQLDAAARYGGHLIQAQGGSLEDVLIAEEMLQVGAVRLLAAEQPANGIATLRESLEAEGQALGDVAAFSSCAVNFHEGLIAATGNQSIALLAGILRGIVERHVMLVAAKQRPTARPPKWRTKSHEVHAQVLDLIVAGQVDDAEHLWRRHLVASRRAMMKEIPIKNVIDLFA
jgi:DNA-binding FadR family transcriptional regulator